jgi:hypothetical protein
MVGVEGLVELPRVKGSFRAPLEAARLGCFGHPLVGRGPNVIWRVFLGNIVVEL